MQLGNMDLLQHLESDIFPAALLHAAGVPSASIAILSDGKISSHVITSGPENEETVYQACSISKAITGLAVAELVEQGKISYSTPIQDHLPENVIDTLIDKATAHLLPLVTVSMILSHTSGLSQTGFPGYETEPASADSILAGEAPSNTPRVRFASFPGEQQTYSGGGYTVLQIFLETLLGQPFAQIMQDLVLKPLNMTRSHYGALPESESNYTDAYYTAYTKSRAGHHVLPEQAAAGLWTTPTDLLKAISAVQQSLKSDGGFLRPDVAKDLLQAKHECMAAGNYSSHGFFVTETALGHAGSNEPGYKCYALGSHGGYVDTTFGAKEYSSEEAVAPEPFWESGNGVAIMTNSVIGDAAYVKLLRAVFYLQKWPGVDPFPCLWAGIADTAPCAAPSATLVEEGWPRWVGRWEGGWRLEDRGGSPALGYRDAGLMELRPAAAPTRILAGEKKEIFLVAVGLEVAVKLTWDGEERVLTVMQDSGKTLKRA